MTIFKDFVKAVQQHIHERSISHKYSVNFEDTGSKASWVIRWTNYKQPVPYEEEVKNKRRSVNRRCYYR